MSSLCQENFCKDLRKQSRADERKQAAIPEISTYLDALGFSESLSLVVGKFLGPIFRFGESPVRHAPDVGRSTSEGRDMQHIKTPDDGNLFSRHPGVFLEHFPKKVPGKGTPRHPTRRICFEARDPKGTEWRSPFCFQRKRAILDSPREFLPCDKGSVQNSSVSLKPVPPFLQASR